MLFGETLWIFETPIIRIDTNVNCDRELIYWNTTHDHVKWDLWSVDDDGGGGVVVAAAVPVVRHRCITEKHSSDQHKNK